MNKPGLAFVGLGRLGTALALRFHELGYRIVGLSSRDPLKAQSLAGRLGCQVVSRPRADLIFLTVPDGEITAVSAKLAGRGGLIHCSGAHSLDIFAQQEQGLWPVGSFHPLYAFTADTRLTGEEHFLVAIEASSPELARALHKLARDLGASPVQLAPEAKAQYHAAAVIASNYVVTLFAASLTLLTDLGVPPEAAQHSLAQLMASALGNLREHSPAAALTGPIARGDVSTVRRHLEALPAYQDLYRLLGRYTLTIAPNLDENVRQLLLEALAESEA